jgi:hypothetical protein
MNAADKFVVTFHYDNFENRMYSGFDEYDTIEEAEKEYQRLLASEGAQQPYAKITDIQLRQSKQLK